MPTKTSPDGHTEVEKRTRVLLITARADHGGGPRHIFDLLQSFQNSEFDFYVAAPNQEPYFTKFENLARQMIEIPARSFSLSAFLRLRRFVRDNGIQIVHSHGRGAGLYSRLLTLTGLARTSVVHSFHGIHSEPSIKGRVKLILDRVLAFTSFTPLFVSESEKSEALRTGSIRTDHGSLSVIENAVDGSRFKARLFAAFENTAAPVIRAGSLMRPDHAKAPDLFLALAKTKAVTWSCVGVTRLELEEYGEIGNLETIGRVAEPADWLTSLDVYVSTSRSEGLPLGVLEAMTAGCICILSDIPAHRSFANSGAALLFDAEKPESFNAVISRLKLDVELRASLLKKSKELVKSHHSLAAFRSKLESVYRAAADLACPRCPMCGDSTARRRRMLFRYEAETSAVFECASCKTAFLAPQPSSAWLKHEYAGYYNRRSSGVEKLEHFRRFFKTHSPVRFRKVLEVGGGEGACARALLEVSPQANLTVVEAHADAAKFYSEIRCTLVAETLEAWLDKNREKFELIVMFDVLEHVRDPRMILDSLANCLEPGGEIWLSVPNYDSVSRKLLGRIWPQYKPEHLFYFSQKGLRSVCKQSGLGSVQINRHLKHLPVSYVFNVGAGFGPKIIQRTFGILKSLVPDFVQAKAITFCLGERLIIARRESHQAVPR